MGSFRVPCGKAKEHAFVLLGMREGGCSLGEEEHLQSPVLQMRQLSTADAEDRVWSDGPSSVRRQASLKVAAISAAS